jgi:hypothetical protein
VPPLPALHVAHAVFGPCGTGSVTAPRLSGGPEWSSKPQKSVLLLLSLLLSLRAALLAAAAGPSVHQVPAPPSPLAQPRPAALPRPQQAQGMQSSPVTWPKHNVGPVSSAARAQHWHSVAGQEGTRKEGAGQGAAGPEEPCPFAAHPSPSSVLQHLALCLLQRRAHVCPLTLCSLMHVCSWCPWHPCCASCRRPELGAGGHSHLAESC